MPPNCHVHPGFFARVAPCLRWRVIRPSDFNTDWRLCAVFSIAPRAMACSGIRCRGDGLSKRALRTSGTCAPAHPVPGAPPPPVPAPAQVRARGRAAAHSCPLCCASFRHVMPGSSAAVRWSRGAADGGALRVPAPPGTRTHTRGAPAQPGVLITARLPPPPRCLRGPSRRRRLRRVLSPRAHWS
jgi:hypothetical protein